MFGHIKRGEQVIKVHYPVMRYNTRDSALVVSIYDPKVKRSEYKRLNERLVIDFGRAKHGIERFVKGQKYDLIEVALTEPLPEPPDEFYLPVGLLRVVVPSLGMVDFIVDYDPMADAVTGLYDKYCDSAEARQNQLPVVEFAAMNFSIVEWLDRDVDIFGKRLVEMPSSKIDLNKLKTSYINSGNSANASVIV